MHVLIFTKAKWVLGFSVWIIAGEQPPLPQDCLLRTNWNYSALNNLHSLITPRLTLASILLRLSWEVRCWGCHGAAGSPRSPAGTSPANAGERCPRWAVVCQKACGVLISPSLTMHCFSHSPIVLSHLLTTLQRTLIWPVPGETCTESGPWLGNGMHCGSASSSLPIPPYPSAFFIFPPENET